MDCQFKIHKYARGTDFPEWFDLLRWILIATPGCVNIATDGLLAEAPVGKPNLGNLDPQVDAIANIADPPVMVHVQITMSANYKALALIYTSLSGPIASSMAGTLVSLPWRSVTVRANVSTTASGSCSPARDRNERGPDRYRRHKGRDKGRHAHVAKGDTSSSAESAGDCEENNFMALTLDPGLDNFPSEYADDQGRGA
eukprot:gene681-2113_t